MKTSTTPKQTRYAIKLLAADDLRVGDYVTVVSQVSEYPAFFWCADSRLLPPEMPVKIRWLPRAVEPPLRVHAVCVPLVLVEASDGECRQLDLRTVQLARLDRAYAKLALKKLRLKTTRRKRHRRIR